jgi:UDPglucose--hexose-1-phosphate uridylyltransferase
MPPAAPPLLDRPHRRFNPLTGEFVLVSPHRTQRPWQGKLERRAEPGRPAHDATCYLCPGNSRASGQTNPPYAGTFAFDNDFAALLAPDGEAWPPTHELLRAEPESGYCRVVCFSPRHDLSLPELSPAEISGVIDTWTEETRTLASRPDVNYVQIFENKGELMGCSNPHPHSQIWATRHLPNELTKELAHQRDYFLRHTRPLLVAYLEQELARSERLVVTNDDWVALVPFWALWPFETLVLPRRPVASLLDLGDRERRSLGDLVRRLTIRYDNLFETSFPYSMGIHQAPFDGGAHPEWILHLHFYPPLLRSATVRKFMVGYEMLATPGRDFTPEFAADRLRDVSEQHYGGKTPGA